MFAVYCLLFVVVSCLLFVFVDSDEGANDADADGYDDDDWYHTWDFRRRP